MQNITDAIDLRNRAHTLTHHDYREALQALVTAPPPVKFRDLAASRLYYYATSYDGGKAILRVHRITPSRRKIVASILRSNDNGEPQDLYAGSYYGDFHCIDKDTLELCRMNHRDLVAAAAKAGAECPAEVRREYPDLFMSIPPEFKPEDVSRALTGWGTRITGPTELVEAIESTHESLRIHDRDAALLLVHGIPGHAQAENDKARASLLGRLGFYLWLEPLVQPGAIFFIQPQTPCRI